MPHTISIAPNIISGMSAGTTTGLSELYEPIRFDHFEFATIASPQTVGVPFAVTRTAITSVRDKRPEG
ncbi:MAG: hypothetical protein OHK0052_12180 [Anaerolineales bacterium]